MKQNPISPDDPRLTAYALHEMEPAEQAEFAELLRQDPAAQQAVEDIRATTALLTTALEDEPVEPVRPLEVKKAGSGKILRFPQFYFMVSGLAAACFAVFFVYWQQNQPVYQSRKYVEVPLAPLTQEKADAKAKTSDVGVTFALKPAPTPEAVEVAAESKRREMSDKLEADAASRAKDQAEARPAMLAKAGSAPAPAVVPLEEETVTLSPFKVEAEQPASATAANSVAVARIQPGQVSVTGTIGVVTKQFLVDESVSPGRSRDSFGNSGVAAPARLGAVKSNAEAYAFRKDSDYLRVADQPLSTFSADVDTASYANVRRFLTQGQRPPADAVRIEELVNYFPYSYAPPTGNAPFAASLEVAAAPWAPEHRLVRIGLKGREVSEAARPAANLVFLLDVSGSMNEPNKLPLVKQSLRLLVQKLRPDDRVAIAVYAGASGLALPSTPVSHQTAILEAIDRLQAEGSTNGEAGIQLAYDIAKANLVPGGVNRVILATDGDFNVGVSSEGELLRLVQEKAKSGVFLSVLGFGMGNLKDSQLEQLADKGNGNYAYIDSLAEARKALVEQAGGTLMTIAKDVKLQVEFNPALVQAYRLIGYENRLLAAADFNNDKVDAGEIGAGHTVTALYEIVPVGVKMPSEMPAVDPLKYQAAGGRGEGSTTSAEMLTVKIRYKEPAGEVSSRLEFPLRDAGLGFEKASADFKFAAAVAAFGMILRDSPHVGLTKLPDVESWARAGLNSDAGGYRNEFISLVARAGSLAQ